MGFEALINQKRLRILFVIIPNSLPDDDVVQPQIAMTADLVNRT